MRKRKVQNPHFVLTDWDFGHDPAAVKALRESGLPHAEQMAKNLERYQGCIAGTECQVNEKTYHVNLPNSIVALLRPDLAYDKQHIKSHRIKHSYVKTLERMSEIGQEMQKNAVAIENLDACKNLIDPKTKRFDPRNLKCALEFILDAWRAVKNHDTILDMRNFRKRFTQNGGIDQRRIKALLVAAGIKL